VPLHEIVLRFADRDELRLGDGPGYEQDEEVVVDGRTFVVIGTEPPQAATTSKRFILELAQSPGADDHDGE
jgi:putative intracellular protease/amidase